MSTVVIAIAGIAIVAYTIGSQIHGTPIRAKRLVVLPAIITVVGAVHLSGRTVHPSGTDIGLIALGALIAAVIGLALGSLMRLEERDGWLWGQLPRRGLWLWLSFFISRGALIGIASSRHAHVAGGTDAELLILGINRLGQAAVVGIRAYLSSIPFVPESDGSRPLGGLFAAAVGNAGPADSDRRSPQEHPFADADQTEETPRATAGAGVGIRPGGRVMRALGDGADVSLGSRRSARRARRRRF